MILNAFFVLSCQVSQMDEVLSFVQNADIQHMKMSLGSGQGLQPYVLDVNHHFLQVIQESL